MSNIDKIKKILQDRFAKYNIHKSSITAAAKAIMEAIASGDPVSTSDPAEYIHDPRPNTKKAKEDRYKEDKKSSVVVMDHAWSERDSNIPKPENERLKEKIAELEGVIENSESSD